MEGVGQGGDEGRGGAGNGEGGDGAKEEGKWGSKKIK